MSLRPSIDVYMMNLARMAATRATCPRRAVGAILAKDGKVVSTGYNGAPPSMQHCFGEGCKNPSGNCINTIHAEANAIIHSTEKGDALYCTDQPCLSCLKIALAHNPEIRIMYWREYPDQDRDAFCNLHKLDLNMVMDYKLTLVPQLIAIGETFHQSMIDTLPQMKNEKLPDWCNKS